MEEKYNWNLQDIFENEEQFKKGYDLVVIVRPSAKEKGYHEIESALLHLGGKLDIRWSSYWFYWSDFTRSIYHRWRQPDVPMCRPVPSMDWKQYRSTELLREVFWQPGEYWDVIPFHMVESIRFRMNSYLLGGKKFENNSTYQK